MSRLIRWLDRKLYPRFAPNWDDELLRRAILERLRPEMDVLDLGAGRGAVPQMNFRGRARRITGLDPDPRVVSNPYVDEGIEGSGDRMPFPDETFDLVICDNVLEHIAEPERLMKEVARVLKPGGWFLAKTPNRRHYMPLIARLTPTAFHRAVNRMRGRQETDTFPTRYRVNTPREIERSAGRSGLEVDQISLIEGRPEYLRFSGLTYPLGALYERLVNSTEVLSRFRILMLIALRKPQASS